MVLKFCFRSNILIYPMASHILCQSSHGDNHCIKWIFSDIRHFSGYQEMWIFLVLPKLFVQSSWLNPLPFCIWVLSRIHCLSGLFKCLSIQLNFFTSMMTRFSNQNIPVFYDLSIYYKFTSSCTIPFNDGFVELASRYFQHESVLLFICKAPIKIDLHNWSNFLT